jgi:hypothetical protein
MNPPLESIQEFDVNKEHEEYKEILRDLVLKAVNNRQRIHMGTGKLSDEDTDKRKESASDLKHLSDEDIINFGDRYSYQPHLVCVRNSHDYAVLIKITMEVLKGKGVVDSEQLRDSMEYNLEHEFEHHVRALGKVNLEYCLEFFEDIETRQFTIRPSVRLLGKATFGTYKDIVTGPSKLSHGDEEIVETIG